MIQVIVNLITIAAAILALFTAAWRLKCSGMSLTGLFCELDMCLADSPAQVAFFMFSIAAAMAATVLVAAFYQFATLWIITLDILSIQSSLLLIKFHRLKMHSLASL